MPKYVRDLPPRDPVCVEFEDTIETAVACMKRERIHSVIVRTPDGVRPWYIFTSSDHLRVDGTDIDLTEPVGSYASIITHVVTKNTSLQDCKLKMATFGIHHLPIVNNQGEYIGMVSQEDLR